MFEAVKIRYVHPMLKLGVQDIRNVLLLEDEPVRLTASIHRGNLVFRFPGSGKRISYRSLKQGLIKKTIIIRKPLYLLPF